MIGQVGMLVAVSLLVAIGMSSSLRAADDGVQRKQWPLKDAWLVKQLDTDKPNVAALMRESAAPNKSWLPARMPAQMHEILLEQGLIADPHVGKNAAACAWVGEKDWAYVCRFATPQTIPGPALLRFEGLDTIAAAYLNGAPNDHQIMKC